MDFRIRNIILSLVLMFLVLLTLNSVQSLFITYDRSTRAPPPFRRPFITFFEDDYQQGDYYHHFLKPHCTNLPAQYANWASSVNVYKRCVYLCDARDCGGKCQRIHAGSRGVIDNLHRIDLNDKVASVRYCYTFAERVNYNKL